MNSEPCLHHNGEVEIWRFGDLQISASLSPNGKAFYDISKIMETKYHCMQLSRTFHQLQVDSPLDQACILLVSTIPSLSRMINPTYNLLTSTSPTRVSMRPKRAHYEWVLMRSPALAKIMKSSTRKALETSWFSAFACKDSFRLSNFKQNFNFDENADALSGSEFKRLYRLRMNSIN